MKTKIIAPINKKLCIILKSNDRAELVGNKSDINILNLLEFIASVLQHIKPINGATILDQP